MYSSQLLFVYGTLGKNFTNKMANFLHYHAIYISKAWIYGQLYDIGEYPGIILSHKRGEKVFGELFYIKAPKLVWPCLDKYEDAITPHGEYNRQVITCYRNEQTIKANIYIYKHSLENKKQILQGKYF